MLFDIVDRFRRDAQAAVFDVPLVRLKTCLYCASFVKPNYVQGTALEIARAFLRRGKFNLRV